MIQIIKVADIDVLDDFRLRIRFTDGAVGVHSFADMVAETGAMIEPLRDPAFFKRVFIECGVLTWPNGFDIDAIYLHDEMKSAGELVAAAAE
jgi:hypothetical protein